MHEDICFQFPPVLPLKKNFNKFFPKYCIIKKYTLEKNSKTKSKENINMSFKNPTTCICFYVNLHFVDFAL